MVSEKSKTYSYFSRYSNVRVLYDSDNKKRYYDVSKKLKKDGINYIIHKTKENETLDGISLKYYGNPLYWWIIADFNNIIDIFKMKANKELKVPYFNQLNFN